MSAGYGDKVSRQDFNYHNFLIKRIIRLYPLHIICLFVAAALALIAGSFSVKDIALLGINALLLQSWIPIRGVYFSFNAVSWCLADLVFFYALFPCLRKAFSKVGLKVSLAFIAVLIVIYLGIATVIPDNLTHPLLYISPLFRLLDFIIGIILYDLYKYISESWRQKKINVSILELVSIIFVSGAILLYPYIPDRYVFASYWWFPISCLVVVFALSDKLGGGQNCAIVGERLAFSMRRNKFQFLHDSSTWNKDYKYSCTYDWCGDILDDAAARIFSYHPFMRFFS